MFITVTLTRSDGSGVSTPNCKVNVNAIKVAIPSESEDNPGGCDLILMAEGVFHTVEGVDEVMKRIQHVLDEINYRTQDVRVLSAGEDD